MISKKLDDLGGKHFLSLFQSWLMMVEKDGHYQIRLEPITPGIELLSKETVSAMGIQLENINKAIREGDILVTPGLGDVKFVNAVKAIEALAPGLIKKGGETSLTDRPDELYSVGGQWYPPGVTIELTRIETDELMFAFRAGTGAVFVGAVIFRLAPVGVLAGALILELGALELVRLMSPQRRVGLKFAYHPPSAFLVTPFPIL